MIVNKVDFHATLHNILTHEQEVKQSTVGLIFATCLREPKGLSSFSHDEVLILL